MWPTSAEYGWRVNPDAALTQDASDAERAVSQQRLQSSVWQSFLDLPALFPPALVGKGRRGQRGRRESRAPVGIVSRAGGLLHLESFFPAGLGEFLAGCTPAPSTFEELCQGVWAWDASRVATPPQWFWFADAQTTGEGDDKLRQMWWSSLVGYASAALQQFQVASRTTPWLTATLVHGVFFKTARGLGFEPHERVLGDEFQRRATSAGYRVVTVPLSGEHLLVCKGVQGNQVWQSIAAEADGNDETDNDASYIDRQHRLVLVWWSIDDEDDRWRQKPLCTLHYVKRVDMTKRSLLFEREFLVRVPLGARLRIKVTVGPWAGHGHAYFQLYQRHQGASLERVELLSPEPAHELGA